MTIEKRRPECRTIKDVVLANLNLTEQQFFDTTKKYYIKDLDKAIGLLQEAGFTNEKITIVGDYDADGICASSILSLVFKELNWRHSVRLPKRFSEGYGLSEEIVDEIDEGLLITVDNGITAFDAIKKAKDKGLTVIVTDHHLPDAETKLPIADVLIDPNAIPNTATFNSYCGAGLAYKIAIELLGEKHPLIPKLTILAGIATVADVMPLTEENRIIVKNALKLMVEKECQTSGIRAMLSECKQEKYYSAKNIAFKIAPMINAPARLYDDGAKISFDMLTFDGNYVDSSIKASEMTRINDERKHLKEKYTKLLVDKIHKENLQNNKPLIIYEKDLHEGLIGILAGQLAETFQTPAFVFTNSDEKGIIKGSGRTYGSINIKSLLDKHADVIAKYGGHAEAAGVSLEEEKFDLFKSLLMNELSDYQPPEDDKLYYDLQISAKQIDLAIKNLEIYEPFGQGNPEIIFLIRDFIITDRKYLQDGKTIKFIGSNADAIGFDLGEAYKAMGEPKVVTLVGVLGKNCFMNSVKNQIEIIKIINTPQQNNMTPMAQALANLANNN